ncbi:GntR family transcriptional regulator [Croceicoccus sp. BE223]|uniref:GntR family transcriptional regulator n=1 Tax=Croceicoccus sp. BE223 TaxID=2817716 RepID=UPI002863403A|nr:GntR family transcriptional regulator [Croceicoccus sp. BE223]MDR7102350.1 DNA-binding GntR family transcriptional regulator [Croceicoccus sp. BE223]
MTQVLKETIDADTDKGSASDRVAAAIVKDIRMGRLVPGQHLLEPELTGRLGISRGSLREALKHLAADGIVTLSRFRGAYISTLDRKAVYDLLDTLEPLARLAARKAAENNRSAKMSKELRNSAMRLEELQASGKRGDYLTERRYFYDLLIEMGGNGELARVIPLSRADLFRAQVETRQNEAQRRKHAEGYRLIAEAVTAGNVGDADRLMGEHFAGTRVTMDQLADEVFPAA